MRPWLRFADGKGMVMSRYFYLLLATLLTPALAPADSIRVGDEFYRDVYIRESKEFYYVYHPDEGRMDKVSRRRSTVSKVSISDDAEYRDGLMQRYRERAAAPPAERAPAAAVHTLEGDLVKHRQQMKDLAVFESQLAHWKTLPPDIQEDIEAGLYETLAQRTARRGLERERALAQLQELGNTKATVEEQLASAAQARAAAVRQAQAADESDFYLRAYENSKGYVGPVYHYYYDDRENLRAFPTWWYTEDPSLYDAALAERSGTRREIDAAEQAYAKRASAYGSQLESVDRAMTQRERAARAAVAKAIDERHRYGGRQAQVAALAAATEAGYLSRLMATTLESWSGAAAQRTPEFSVGRGLWRLDCRVADGGTADAFAATVYDAKTGKPFTRIAGPDFLGMRTRIFDEPGRYYLVVEQGLVHVPYEIEVSALSFR